MNDYMAPERTYRAFQQGQLTYPEIYLEARARQAAALQHLTVRAMMALGHGSLAIYRKVAHVIAVRREQHKLVTELADKDPRIIREAGFSPANLEAEARVAAERIVARRAAEMGHGTGRIMRFPVEARRKPERQDEEVRKVA